MKITYNTGYTIHTDYIKDGKIIFIYGRAKYTGINGSESIPMELIEEITDEEPDNDRVYRDDNEKDFFDAYTAYVEKCSKENIKYK